MLSSDGSNPFPVNDPDRASRYFNACHRSIANKACCATKITRNHIKANHISIDRMQYKLRYSNLKIGNKIDRMQVLLCEWALCNLKHKRLGCKPKPWISASSDTVISHKYTVKCKSVSGASHIHFVYYNCLLVYVTYISQLIFLLGNCLTVLFSIAYYSTTNSRFKYCTIIR